MSILHRFNAALLALATSLMLTISPAVGQIESVDPNDTYSNAATNAGEIDGDLQERPGDGPVYADEPSTGQPVGPPPSRPAFGDNMGAPNTSDDTVAPSWNDPVVTASDAQTAAAQASANPEVAAAQGDTFKEDDLIGAAQGLFGDGAKEVAGLIQDLLKDQGEPNGYIVGREASGAFIIGARYGSGTLYHKVEGQRPVYWTGPSIGFDAGANAGNTFILVYNLYDTEDLYKRFPAGEGQAYAIGGMTASYMRWGDTVLIPIRVGAGLRLGINAGYMKFSKKQRWLPF